MGFPLLPLLASLDYAQMGLIGPRTADRDYGPWTIEALDPLMKRGGPEELVVARGPRTP